MEQDPEILQDFTHGDLRTDAVYSCENEIVFNHDAEFVFGSGSC